jgi:hypothetical protein
MITKGGVGSGIRGHRTIRSVVDGIPTVQRFKVLETLKQERARREAEKGKAPDAGKKPKAKSSIKLSPKAKKEALDKLKAEQKKRSGKQTQFNTEARGHLEGNFDSKKKKMVAIMTDLKVDESQAAEYVKTFKEYTGRNYSSIRKGEGKFAEDQKRLESFIEKAPTWDSKGTLYRGLSMPIEQAAKLKKGKVFDMMGTSSWSSDKTIADEFATKKASDSITAITFVVNKINKGSSISHLSYSFEEKEVLVSQKSKFKITKIQDGPPGISQLFVHVDEVD